MQQSIRLTTKGSVQHDQITLIIFKILNLVTRQSTPLHQSLQFNDFSIYHGDIEYGLFNGDGTFKYKNGTQISMKFIENNFDGYAKYIL